jgi:hypothetical protein
MKLRRAATTCLLFCVAAGLAVAAPQDDSGEYNEYAIMPSHFPKNAPRFEDYPAARYDKPGVPARWRDSAMSRMYRTRLSAWSRERPNFAGHFILATWGCGTDCTQLAVIDARNGKVFHPQGVTSNVAVNVHPDLLEPAGSFMGAWHGEGALRYRADSRLLVLIGAPNEDNKRRGISFYQWTDTQLKLVRHVHVAWYPD